VEQLSIAMVLFELHKRHNIRLPRHDLRFRLVLPEPPRTGVRPATAEVCRRYRSAFEGDRLGQELGRQCGAHPRQAPDHLAPRRSLPVPPTYPQSTSQALIVLARRWVNVVRAMLRDDTTFEARSAARHSFIETSR
jgi:hypothetical protein